MISSARRAFAAISPIALAGAIACTGEEAPSGSRRLSAAPAAGTAASAAPAASPTASADAGPTPNTGQDITSRIDGSASPAPGETLAPVLETAVKPTPLGALTRATSVPEAPLHLAFLQNTVQPYVLRQGSLVGFGSSGQIGEAYTEGIGEPKGLAADGAQDLWVLSADPPHVDHWQLGPGGLGLVASYSACASPSAIAAGEGEAWVGCAGGVLRRIEAATGATASFSGFGEPAAIALDQGHVWVASATGAVFEADRAGGALLATYGTGAQPTGLAIDNSGTVWTADQGAAAATRITAGGATSSIALGATPSAVVADARRIWFALPRKLAYFGPDGTREGEAALEVLDFEGEVRTYEPASLAIDAYDRIWALDRQAGELLAVWGRRPGE